MKVDNLTPNTTVLCGTSFAKVLTKLTADMPNARIVPVVNKFFGERVNVSGLLTGSDIIRAIKNDDAPQSTDKSYLITVNCLKAGEEIFLDDWTVDDLRRIFAPAQIIPIRNGIELMREIGL